MATNDVAYIMNNLKKFGDEYFTKADNKNVDIAYSKQGKKNGRNGDKTDDQSCYFNAVPPMLYAILEKHTELMMEYTDTKVNEAREEGREEGKREVKEMEEKMTALKSELRFYRNDQDALACYNRRENIKIQGVEYQEGENTNEIVKDIC